MSWDWLPPYGYVLVGERAKKSADLEEIMFIVTYSFSIPVLFHHSQLLFLLSFRIIRVSCQWAYMEWWRILNKKSPCKSPSVLLCVLIFSGARPCSYPSPTIISIMDLQQPRLLAQIDLWVLFQFTELEELIYSR